MSINVVLTSDKCQFQNHFSDALVMPKNASVALTKASMVLPIMVQNILKVPQIVLADRANFCMSINIDGIVKDISWTDFFTAYSQYDRINNIEPSLDANKFFRGDYEFWTNNYVYLENNVAGGGDKPKISWVISQCINNAFEFYSCTDISNYNDVPIGFGQDLGSPNTTIIRPAFGANPAVSYSSELLCTKKINTKLNIEYNPDKITAEGVTEANFVAGDLIGFVAADNQLVTTANPNMACGNDITVDLNGGYLITEPVLTAGWLAFGFSLEGNGFNNIGYQPIAAGTLGMIDIGIEFSIEAVSGSHVYRIIDGQLANNLYDGGTTGSFYSPHFHPNQPVCKFTNDLHNFAILCRRGNIVNGNYEYIFDIYMGSNATAEPSLPGSNNMKIIYTSRKTLNRSGIDMVPLFFGSSDNLNRFDDINYIDMPIFSDSLQQGNNKATDAVKIQPVLDGRDNEEVNFWSAIGLHSYAQTAAGQLNQTKSVVSYDGTPLNKTIQWKTNYKDGDFTDTNVSYYWIGKRNLNDFFYFDTANEAWRVNQNVALLSLPKLLNVYLLNLSLKNYSGTFNNFNTVNAAIDTTTGEDRLVGTIPLVVDDTTAPSEVEIQYETFNPYYRPLNNADNYQINEFIVEISYKDFNTDIRKIINDIDGVLKLELNIRRGADPNVKKIMGSQGIMPII